jgi:peptidoglycan/LPS O-acetylase OafA/YrhL
MLATQQSLFTATVIVFLTASVLYYAMRTYRRRYPERALRKLAWFALFMVVTIVGVLGTRLAGDSMDSVTSWGTLVARSVVIGMVTCICCFVVIMQGDQNGFVQRTITRWFVKR